MKKIFIVLVIVLCYSCANAQNDILIRISSSIELAPYTTGYINSSGDTIIPIGKYVYCFTEKFDKIAIVVPKIRASYVAIDRNEKVLFEVAAIDNGPDQVKEGLFRIKKDGKFGYANMNGDIVIKPQFDSALPFENGYAIVCYGGKDVIVGEYKKRVGGKWGFINTSGRFVIEPIYDDARSVNEIGKAKVMKDGEWKIIDVK